jgi:hypothetical protein
LPPIELPPAELPPAELPPAELPLDVLSPEELPPAELALDELPADAPPLPDPLVVASLPVVEPLVVAPLVPPAFDDGPGGTKLVSQPIEGAIIAHVPVNAIPSHAKELKDRSAMDLSFFEGANPPTLMATDGADHGAI